MKKSKKISGPPRLLEYFLANANVFRQFGSLGDFEEDYKKILSKKGKFKAVFWYFSQTIVALTICLKELIYWSFIMFKNYFKTAFRNIKRQKILTFINIFGLSLGIACCLLILLWVQDEFSYDRFHKNADNIFEVYGILNMGNFRAMTGAPLPMGKTLQKEFPEVKASAIVDQTHLGVKTGGNVYKQKVFFTEPAFFEIFSFEMKDGISEKYLTGTNDVIITESLAYKCFGSAETIGKFLSILINGIYKDFIVTAVIRDFPQNSSLKCDLLLNIDNLYKEVKNEWGNNQRKGLFLLLKDKNFTSELEKAFPDFLKKYADENGFKYLLQPLTDYHLKAEHSWVMKENSRPVFSYMLSGIAFLVLIIACFNFTNMAIGNSSSRTREIAVRKVVGAEKRELFKQYMFETTLISFLALITALVLAVLFLPTFNILSGKMLVIGQLLNPRALTAIMIIMIITTVIAGSYPAFVLARFKSVDLFRKKIKISGKNIFTKVLIVLQFSISIFLIAATLFLRDQYNFMLKKDLGYSPENTIVIPVKDIDKFPNKGKTILTAFKQSLLKYGDIESVSSANWDLATYYAGTLVKDNEGNQSILVFTGIDQDYIKTLNLELVEGRNFSYDFAEDLKESVLVNETFVREFNIKNPIGRKFSEFFEKTANDYKIIGIIKDFHSESLHKRIRPTFLTFGKEQGYQYIYIRIKPGNYQGTLSSIKKELSKIAPNIPFVYNFLDEMVIEKYEMEKRWSRIIDYSSIFAVLIACSGLFGLTLLTAAKRTKELSLRKIFGASTGNIIKIIQRDFLVLVILANIIGWPAVYFAVKKLFENFAYKIPIGPLPFIAAGFGAAVVAAVTISTIGIKITRTNPVDTLRYE